MPQLILILAVVFSLSSWAQNPKWLNYNTLNSPLPSNEIRTIAVDSNDGIWVGSLLSGLSYFKDSSWKVFDNSNSTLESDENITDILVDRNNDIWIASSELHKFNGSTWKKYSTSNSNIPFNPEFIEVDTAGNLWGISTTGKDLFKYNGDQWLTFDSSFFVKPLGFVSDFLIDDEDIIWLAGNGTGLLKFDGSSWSSFDTIYYVDTTKGYSSRQLRFIQDISVDQIGQIIVTTKVFGFAVFDKDTSWTWYDRTDLPFSVPVKITADQNNNYWCSEDQFNGLLSFDGNKWLSFTPSNSGIPGSIVSVIVIDRYNNKWLGMEGAGLSVYNEGGVIIGEDVIRPVQEVLVFPNPSAGIIQVSSDEFEVLDVSGKILLHFSGKWGDVSDLPRGMYLIRAWKHGNMYYSKIIRK